jgi:hypothetical protein
MYCRRQKWFLELELGSAEAWRQVNEGKVRKVNLSKIGEFGMRQVVTV